MPDEIDSAVGAVGNELDVLEVFLRWGWRWRWNGGRRLRRRRRRRRLRAGRLQIVRVRRVGTALEGTKRVKRMAAK